MNNLDTNPICQRCKSRPSTGVLVHLCDPCFDQWEAETNANPSNPDIAPIDSRIKRASAGGDIPDNADAVVLVAGDEALLVTNGNKNTRLN